MTDEEAKVALSRNRPLSQSDIARLFGLNRALINVWRSRRTDFPSPDIEIGIYSRAIPGWRPERMDEIRAWLAEHPRLVSH